MKQLGLRSAFGITLCTTALITSLSPAAYASGRPAMDLRSLSLAPGPQRVFLASAFEGSHADPMTRLDVAGHGSSLEDLAYKISFVGGLLLTADHLVRSMDSVMDATAYKAPDGSCLRLNAEPCSRGFLVGLTMSRPLDF